MKKIIVLFLFIISISVAFALPQNFGDIVKIKSVTTDYAVTSSDQVIFVDASGGNKIITLPSPVGKTGKTYTIIRKDTTVNIIRVNGLSDYIWIDKQQLFVSDGSYWWPQTPVLGGLVGSAYIGSSCSWSTTSSTPAAFPTSASCDGPTVDLISRSGVTIATTDTNLPLFTYGNLPPGYYTVSMSFRHYGTTTSYNASFSISDGTSTKGYLGSRDASGIEYTTTLIGNFYYATGGDRSFSLYGSSESGGTTYVTLIAAGAGHR